MTTTAPNLFRRLEQLLAIASFGAASAFALWIAFILSPEEYGRLMTVQAAIVIVVSLATMRTYDLSYFAVTQLGASPSKAFRISATVELATLVATVAIAFGILHIAASLVPENFSALILLFAAVMLSMGNLQGASVARLRQAGAVRAILVAEVISVAAWAAAGALILFGVRDIGRVLLISAAPQAVRYLIVLSAAVAHSRKDRAADEKTAPKWQSIVRFLFTGQIANALKNANTSIETLLVAAFFGPVTVAMYRVARAIQGAPVAALNVLQQRSYPDLTGAPDLTTKRAIRRTLGREAVGLALLFLPICLAVAGLFAWFKPDIDMPHFVMLTAAIYISLLPAAYQQAGLAILTMSGRNTQVGIAYLAGALVLAIGGGILMVRPEIGILVATVIMAALLRAVIVERQASRCLTSTVAPANPRHLP